MEPREVLAHLRRIPIFRDIPDDEDEELLRLVPYVREQVLNPGEMLLTEDRAPDATYLIVSGLVETTRTSPDSGALTFREQRSTGAVLGRMSLEVGDFQQVNATALADTHVLFLNFRELVRAYQKSPYLRNTLNGPLKPERLVRTLEQIPLFGQLTGQAGNLELIQVAGITHEQVYEDGEWVFRQGEVGDRLFYVLSGRIQLSATDRLGRRVQLDTLEQGAIIGETGLLIGDFHDVTAVAEDFARVLYLTREAFAKLLQDRPNLRRKLVVSSAVQSRRQLRTFDWVRDDEWVVDVVQRHWIRLSRQAVVPLLILALLIPAALVLAVTGTAAGIMWRIIVAGILGVPVVGLLLTVAWEYINWRDDFFVVTTQRVVHIERTGPLSTHREETSLEQIQDIIEIQESPAAGILHYGTLVLQSSGETINVDMSFLPHPDSLRTLINEQIERARARSVLRTQGQIRDLLTQRLESDGAPRSQETSPAQDGVQPPRRSAGPMLPLISIWHYFFWPSRTESDGGETIIWRRYWLPGFLHYLPAALSWLLVTVGGPILVISERGTSAFWPLLGGWLFLESVASAVVLWFVEDWRNDFFRLTESQITLVDQLPLLLSMTRRDAPLERIQNLSYEVPNIFARIFDYGNVEFETAGTEGVFSLNYVRHPAKVQNTISNRQHEFRERQRQIEAERRQQELLNWFSEYNRYRSGTGA